ncbi:LacI family transcriptional regulator [Halanaerobium saccharolyticum]|uniref:LacI family transcriptional regulator n=1 Tax=Halanaerobium saccharolyticum TaxID=43595 RepID=A0A4R7YSW8_9FIRM|nr:LacI family DNA-binding transcriptional regulator [Halanaerobium saccharolyticum]RAK05127.1 LacI family transcriptional regulator [Halanaerobium saccharolyticum]TDV98894.1 LacI family transcriptional regulator [Halanaerobium saccharolyticum]TDX51596.1 LacI family transcriptional regulator [Halanaerobium saccharolyticum]
MQITLKDIARMADVAESTVSRALNDKPGVGRETKLKILKIAKENNYRPNQLARGLAAKKTNMLAVIMAEMDSPGNIEIVKSIEKAAEKQGYQIILCNTNNQEEKEKSYLSLLESNQVDGAIFIGGKLVGSHLLRASFSQENAIVLVNRLAEENFFTSVLTDYSQGIYKAVEHLVEQGFKKISLVCGDKGDLIEEEKIDGYKSALTEAGLEVNDDLIFSTSVDRQAGYDVFLEIIEGDVIPDAFISTRELTTIGLVEAIKMGGYFIPDDFAVVGYGDNILTSVIDPPLTVLSEPVEKLGEDSLNFLLKLIKEELDSQQIKVLTPELIIRESSISKYN